ncbi:MAG: ABC transporter substrate-binding protein [Anaerolineae bacterium]|nr:ABC transporter substrate-binding protein [Anaerolineae bacterium]
MQQDGTYRYTMEAPVSTPPQRVVSLVPSVTESLFELGVGDRVIGITDYCVHPAEQVARLPRIGGTKNPDVEQIIALRPDLVIANQEENREADVVALRAAGIPVWVTFPKTVREGFNLLWNFMYVFDEPSMVERIRSTEWLCDWLERMEQPECKVFVPIWSDPLMTFNADTFAHDVLRVCGGTNVFADRERLYPLAADLGQAEPLSADDPRAAGRDTRYPRVTLAEVEAAQPDVILLPSEPFAFNASHIPVFAALDIPAARNQNIRLVDGSLLTWHGTRLARALNTLPNLLCPSKSEV